MTNQAQTTETAVPVKKARKQRSDKGVKRGPHKSKVEATSTTVN